MISNMLNSYIKAGALTSVMLVIGIVSMHAQVKYEGEQKVNQSEVPPAAIDWLCSGFDNMKRLKWYEQFSTGQRSYEAKFKMEGYRYSVAFDTTGNILDIEILLKRAEMEQDALQAIGQHLDANYDRWRLRKIQLQYTGTQPAWDEFLNNKYSDALQVKYEIEYYGKKDDSKLLWEGWFDKTGEFISKRQITTKSADNLNY